MLLRVIISPAPAAAVTAGSLMPPHAGQLGASGEDGKYLGSRVSFFVLEFGDVWLRPWHQKLFCSQTLAPGTKLLAPGVGSRTSEFGFWHCPGLLKLAPVLLLILHLSLTVPISFSFPSCYRQALSATCDNRPQCTGCLAGTHKGDMLLIFGDRLAPHLRRGYRI